MTDDRNSLVFQGDYKPFLKAEACRPRLVKVQTDVSQDLNTVKSPHCPLCVCIWECACTHIFLWLLNGICAALAQEKERCLPTWNSVVLIFHMSKCPWARHWTLHCLWGVQAFVGKKKKDICLDLCRLRVCEFVRALSGQQDWKSTLYMQSIYHLFSSWNTSWKSLAICCQIQCWGLVNVWHSASGYQVLLLVHRNTQVVSNIMSKIVSAYSTWKTRRSHMSWLWISGCQFVMFRLAECDMTPGLGSKFFTAQMSVWLK